MTSIPSQAALLQGQRLHVPLWLVAVVASLPGWGLLAGTASAKDATEIAGRWDVTRDQSPRHCQILLNPERSDKGDFFAGILPACRQMMPALANVGRWSLADSTHLTLSEPGGKPVLAFLADGETFSAPGADGSTYRLKLLAPARRGMTGSGPVVAVQQAEPPAVLELAATKKKPLAAERERPSDLAGRYAVLRDKTHDTGCMLTLDDKTRVKGGDRAALAPACRDQGIVVFDPTAWQIVNGRLVLTAKAGHVTHLDKQDDGTWLKDPAEGKSLSLKKL